MKAYRRTSRYKAPTPYELEPCGKTYPDRHRHYWLREGETFVWLPEDDPAPGLYHYAPCQPYAPIIEHANVAPGEVE